MSGAIGIFGKGGACDFAEGGRVENRNDNDVVAGCVDTVDAGRAGNVVFVLARSVVAGRVEIIELLFCSVKKLLKQ